MNYSRRDKRGDGKVERESGENQKVMIVKKEEEKYREK